MNRKYYLSSISLRISLCAFVTTISACGAGSVDENILPAKSSITFDSRVSISAPPPPASQAIQCRPEVCGIIPENELTVRRSEIERIESLVSQVADGAHAEISDDPSNQ